MEAQHPGAAVSALQAFSIPDYLVSKADGLYVNFSRLSSGEAFALFAGEVFANDFRFAGLDYDVFLKLIYDAEWLAGKMALKSEARLASGLVSFSAQRRALYKTVKVLERGNKAEYVFEPVNVEVTVEEPVYGEPDANGVAPLLRHTSTQVLQPATLDIDEFIAMMWLKGIKYGVQVEAVRMIIHDRVSGRSIVACALPPVEGKDADILEICPHLHQDNSPRTMLNGKADMRSFQNRFPHIGKGERLLKKVPRVMGKQGYKVTGEVIEPAVPADLNLLGMASTGTTAMFEGDGDYLVAQMDGFLNIDPVTKTISITEKIETTAGVSMKTTGDLVLNVEEFVEHGEVQEGRVVRGRHMIFKANVFGNLVSSHGNITLDANLTGGKADAIDGNVTLKRASRAQIHAINGEISAKSCENCLLVARKIRIEEAVNCELVADEIVADKIEGCMLTGKHITIAASADSKSRESLITIMIPDRSEADQRIHALQEKMKAGQADIAGKKQELEHLKADADFAKFMALYDKIKSGEIRLTADQAENWQKLASKNAKSWNQVENINKHIQAVEHQHSELNEQIDKINKSFAETGSGLACTIQNISGLTRGQTMISQAGLLEFSTLAEGEIKSLLQQADPRKTKIFSADEGTINWTYE